MAWWWRCEHVCLRYVSSHAKRISKIDQNNETLSLLQTHTILNGKIQHITHYERSTGFLVCILAVNATNNNIDTESTNNNIKKITLVGKTKNVPKVLEGIRAQGRWTKHETYGVQFAANKIELHGVKASQLTHNELVQHLGKGMVKGFGPKSAEKLVETFGKRTTELLDAGNTSLLNVKGISETKIRELMKRWQELKSDREVMLFLQRHNISPYLGRRLVETFGEELVRVLQTDPYRIMQVHGVGWRKADAIALSLEGTPNNPQRIASGILHVISTEVLQGHSFVFHETIVRKSRSLLSLDDYIPYDDDISKAINDLLTTGVLVLEDLSLFADQPEAGKCDFNQDYSHRMQSNADKIYEPRRWAYYLPRLLHAEQHVAAKLCQILAQRSSATNLNSLAVDAWITEFENRNSLQLSTEQRNAVRTAVLGSVTIITGGPGCGKTYTVRAIVECFTYFKLTTQLVAPTGRSASRLASTVNKSASTIHRALVPKLDVDNSLDSVQALSQTEMRFQHDAKNPLCADVLIVDEASMIDIELFSAFVNALRKHARLIIVGDADQLPPIKAGDVLHDLLASGVIPCVRLTNPFRQALQSSIVSNAALIRAGKMPLLENVSPATLLLRPPSSSSLFVNLDEVRTWAFNDVRNLDDAFRERFGLGTKTSKLQFERESNDSTNPEYLNLQRCRYDNSNVLADNNVDDIRRATVWCVTKLLPSLGFKTYHDMQALSPIRRSSAGASSVNEILAPLLNPSRRLDGGMFQAGDHVLQTSNRYCMKRVALMHRPIVEAPQEKALPLHSVFNGEVGVVSDILLDDYPNCIVVRFSDPDRLLLYTADLLPCLSPAYCITVHKSQGSEYRYVLLYVTTSVHMMLYRSLLYTGFTRAKDVVVLIGHREALSTAVERSKPFGGSRKESISNRNSLLDRRIVYQAREFNIS